MRSHSHLARGKRPRPNITGIAGEDYLQLSLVCAPFSVLPAPLADLESDLSRATLHQSHGTTHVTLAGRRAVLRAPPQADKPRSWRARYRLTLNGVHIDLRGTATSDNTPDAYITIPGNTCLRRGALHSATDAITWLSDLGLTIVDTRVSRVDIAVDLPGIAPSRFIWAYQQDNYACRAKHKSLHTYGASRSLCFGSRKNIQLQIYDKLAQSTACHDEETRDLMRQRRWGNTIPMRATRVEFSVGRAALHTRGIDTLDDYIAKRADLTTYLTNRWCRFALIPVDSRRKSRAGVRWEWRAVQDALAKWAGAGDPDNLKLLTTGPPSTHRLIRQAIGVMLTAAAHDGVDVASLDQLSKYSADQLERLVPLLDPPLHERAAEKQRQVEARGGPTAPNPEAVTPCHSGGGDKEAAPKRKATRRKATRRKAKRRKRAIGDASTHCNDKKKEKRIAKRRRAKRRRPDGSR